MSLHLKSIHHIPTCSFFHLSWPKVLPGPLFLSGFLFPTLTFQEYLNTPAIILPVFCEVTICLLSNFVLVICLFLCKKERTEIMGFSYL